MSRTLTLVASAIVLVGCRLGFDARPIDGGVNDAPRAIARFGERSSSMTSGVTTDTFLDEIMQANNNGGDDQVSVAGSTPNRNRILLRFELSSLPPGTRVMAATLHLVRADYGDEVMGELALHAVAEPWDEGASVALPGAGATWLEAASGDAWSTAGGTLGALLVTQVLPSPATGEDTFALPPAQVQAWIDTPASNAGLAILPASELAQTHYHFLSSEWFAPDERPELVLELEP